MLTDLLFLVHCDGALERFKRFGLCSRVEKVILRRDREKNSSATKARILQGVCLGLTKLGLEWSYRQRSAHQEWLEADIKDQGLLNLPAKHMVYRISKQSGRCCIHPVRNAGTIVVFDRLGKPIDLTRIQAINTYFHDISGVNEGSTTDELEMEPVGPRCERRPIGCATIHPSAEDFRDFCDRWKGSEEN
ncbi:hypothetical protein GGR51DRAFT_35866 [Nemania sp. FL0031]|nr:hypothetical protein GGR51DRAFT_35866 [Nemania sp. FL0031]